MVLNSFYIKAILTASLGGVLFGYDLGVIAGALPPLSAYFQLTPSQEEWIVSLLYFGGGVGAASGGFLCDWFGRRFAILITDVIFGLGAFLLYNAETVKSVMIGRCVVGWAVAVSGIADVAYLHEISSVWGEGGGFREDDEASAVTIPNSSNDDEERRDKRDDVTGGRGSVVSVNEACISLGFLLAYAVAYALSDQSQNEGRGIGEQSSEEWRLMFAFGGFLAAFQFFGMLFMPESPVWLHGKGRIEEAISAQNKIRGRVNTMGNHESGIRHCGMNDHSVGTSSQHMQQSQTVIEMNASPSATHSQPQEQLHIPIPNSKVLDCFRYVTIKIRSTPSQIKLQYQRMVNEIVAPYKRQCAISFILAVSQQFCGHPSVLSFSAEIFTMLSQSGDDDASSEEGSTAIKLTVGIGVLKFLTTCIVIICIDKGGRRMWLLAGTSCILVSLTILCVALIGLNDEDIGHSSGNVHRQSASSLNKDLGIVGIYGVAVGYAASFGPLTWLITSELFPSSIRGRALGSTTIVTYMAAGLVSRTFLSLQKEVGLAGCFALYWMATFFTILFVWHGVPDTGRETPEDIERELNEMWIWGGRRRRKCPSISRWKSRSTGSPPSSSASWTFVGSYGSNNYSPGAASDMDAGGTNTSSTVITLSPVTNSKLTPRHSSSSNGKEIT